jgi:hypothetical protein
MDAERGGHKERLAGDGRWMFFGISVMSGRMGTENRTGRNGAMSGRSTQRPGEVRSVCTADGARLEYEVVGSGPPLVMLHGILSGRASFSRQRAELAEHHRLILISARHVSAASHHRPADCSQ